MRVFVSQKKGLLPPSHFIWTPLPPLPWTHMQSTYRNIHRDGIWLSSFQCQNRNALAMNPKEEIGATLILIAYSLRLKSFRTIFMNWPKQQLRVKTGQIWGSLMDDSCTATPDTEGAFPLAHHSQPQHGGSPLTPLLLQAFNTSLPRNIKILRSDLRTPDVLSKPLTPPLLGTCPFPVSAGLNLRCSTSCHLPLRPSWCLLGEIYPALNPHGVLLLSLLCHLPHLCYSYCVCFAPQLDCTSLNVWVYVSFTSLTWVGMNWQVWTDMHAYVIYLVPNPVLCTDNTEMSGSKSFPVSNFWHFALSMSAYLPIVVMSMCVCACTYMCAHVPECMCKGGGEVQCTDLMLCIWVTVPQTLMSSIS